MTPSLVATALTQDSTSSTSHVLTMPTGITAGQLLITWVTGSFGTISVSGWTTIYSTTTVYGLGCFARIATGSDTGTATTGNGACSAVTCLMQGWSGTLSGIASGTGTTADPPALTPSGGSQDYLWVATVYSTNNLLTAAPTNYTNFTKANSSQGSANIATRALTASSEDPGTFTGSTSSPSGSTVAIPPGSSGLPASFIPPAVAPLTARRRAANF